jgi:hypothetical protein
LGVSVISHELGHAFGLDHVDETKKCLAKHGVDIGSRLHNVIMEGGSPAEDVPPSVYDWPFIPQEKRLLLDENYFPECRPLLGDRPHASWFLRHPLPAENTAPTPIPVNGFNVGMVKFPGGILRMTGPRQWLEEGGGAKFDFVENKRDRSSVFLFDRARNMQVMLDLSQWKLLFSQGAAKFSPLYTLTNKSAADTEIDQSCFDAVQGKVAWDRQGTKIWELANLRSLCRNTISVESTVACFAKEIRNHGDWLRGISSCTEQRSTAL